MPKVCPLCDTPYVESDTFCEKDGASLLVVDENDELIGRSFGNYTISALLGRGGMGNVYLANHKTLKQKAAIKILSVRMQSTPDAAERFKREARNAHRLDHENVVRIFDFGEASDGLLYLVMEYLHGRSLRAIIERDGALSLSRSVDIVGQIARGLDAAHQLKIIHRDVKSDNIMVIEASNGGDRVKIVDFGIARVFETPDSENTPTQMTLTGFNSIVGTPEFMSPEQLTGKRLDGRSDVYALALVAYRCLTAELPFPGETASERTWVRLTSDPLKLADLVPADWPASLQGALDAALSREPELRPATAGAFAESMKAAIVAQVERPPRDQTAWWRTTNRAAVVAAASVVVVASGVLAMRAWTARTKDGREALAPDSTQVATTARSAAAKGVTPSVVDTPNVAAIDTGRSRTMAPQQMAAGEVLPTPANRKRSAVTDTEGSGANLLAIRSWLVTSDARLSDQSAADLSSAADSVLTIFARVDPLHLVRSTDDSVRAYLVWANAVLRRNSTDNVTGACKILKQASALRLRPHAQPLRARYERSLDSCRHS